MRTLLIAGTTLLLLAACGGTDPPAPTDAAAPAGGAPAPAAPAPGAAPEPGTPTAAAAASAAPAAGALAGALAGMGGRTGELVNPDNNAMVFLYYDLTGIAPPIDRWVEEDSRVKYVPAIDKPAQRVAVRAELEAGVAAVRGTGLIRLSLNSANLSDYDPTYGEFTVRALSPSSLVEFAALGQKVTVKFNNGKYAQLWKVPAAESQGVRDRIAMGGNIELDVLLAIRSVLPGPAGGTITTDVIEYELRETRGGTTLARVQLPPT